MVFSAIDGFLLDRVFWPLSTRVHDLTGKDNRRQAYALLVGGQLSIWLLTQHYWVVDIFGVVMTAGFIRMIQTRPRAPRAMRQWVGLGNRLCFLISGVLMSCSNFYSFSDRMAATGYTLNNLLFVCAIYVADCEDDKPRRRRKRPSKALAWARDVVQPTGDPA